MASIPSRFSLIATALFCILASPLRADSPANEPLAAAAQALARGNRDKALGLADKAVQADPKNVECYMYRAAVYDALRQFDKAVSDYAAAIDLPPQSANAYQHRGEDHFRLGHFKESVADFDKVVELDPGQEPYHWQRGISLYHAGAFERGAKQFELHKTVNPEDVENAVWHYMCVARTSGSLCRLYSGNSPSVRNRRSDGRSFG